MAFYQKHYRNRRTGCLDKASWLVSWAKAAWTWRHLWRYCVPEGGAQQASLAGQVKSDTV